jgi:DNA-3-methyladenine glycosylase
MSCPHRSFYGRSTTLVAKELLGKKLVRRIPVTKYESQRLAGLIIETEAYGFNDDAASHAYKGLTPRNKAMFGEVGRAYIYFTYGNHFCVNVSARSGEFKAGAVLIRALEPLEGINVMKRYRKNNDYLSLTSGPGKITQALNITKLLNECDMTNADSDLHIEFGTDPQVIIAKKRIGITKAVDKKWRFVLVDDKYNQKRGV